MESISLDDAQSRLLEIISGLHPGEEVILVQGGQPVAKLTRAGSQQWTCRAGSAKNMRHWMAPDFDAPLDDFREYMS